MVGDKGTAGIKTERKRKLKKGKQTKNPEVALVARVGSVTLPMES